MNFSIDLKPKKLNKDFELGDLTYFTTSRHGRAVYVVWDVERDLKQKFLLLSLWKLSGGYDHQNVNIVLSDLQLMEPALVLQPEKYVGVITKILSYRGKNSKLSPKEEFYFDTYASETSTEPSEQHPFPYEVEVKLEDNTTIKTILPSYTPFSRIPLLKIKEGVKVEVWKFKDDVSILKVFLDSHSEEES